MQISIKVSTFACSPPWYCNEDERWTYKILSAVFAFWNI